MQTTMSRLTRRYVVAVSLALLALLVLAAPTLAGVSWCRSDPIVELGGAQYQVIVLVPVENVPQINGALDFTFYAPKGTETKVLFLDSGYNGYGETVAFATYSDKSQHVMRLDVKHTGEVFPVMVEVYKNNNLVATTLGNSDVITMKLPR